MIKFIGSNIDIVNKELNIAGSHVSISHEDDYATAFVILY